MLPGEHKEVAEGRARAPDRFFGSFPKVGIVIPNAAVWLLPDFYELGNALNMVIDVPTILPHGTRIDTTSDGFLLWLPSSAPALPRALSPPAPLDLAVDPTGCLGRPAVLPAAATRWAWPIRFGGASSQNALPHASMRARSRTYLIRDFWVSCPGLCVAAPWRARVQRASTQRLL